jgi:hypothetical protein
MAKLAIFGQFGQNFKQDFEIMYYLQKILSVFILRMRIAVQNLKSCYSKTFGVHSKRKNK